MVEQVGQSHLLVVDAVAQGEIARNADATRLRLHASVAEHRPRVGHVRVQGGVGRARPAPNELRRRNYRVNQFDDRSRLA